MDAILFPAKLDEAESSDEAEVPDEAEFRATQRQQCKTALLGTSGAKQYITAPVRRRFILAEVKWPSRPYAGAARD